ncbi:MAG: hypothetical protein ACAH95_10655, partial [Fimbriimonas sp.]
MIICVRINHFYTADLLQEPAIVVREKAVLDATPQAIALGVTLGMPFGLAKTLLSKGAPEGKRIVQWKPEDYEEAQERWLDACLPYTDVIEPIDQHEAFLDFSAHPSPEAVLDSLKLPENASIGVAKVKWLAKAALDKDDKNQFAYYAPNLFLDSLPTNMLAPVLPESRARLKFLGYQTAGEIQSISLETLREQFGKEALTIWQAARGRAGKPVQPLYPHAALGARIYFESPVEALETIETAIEEIAVELAKKLEARDLQGSNMRLWIGYEEEPEELLEREFTKPMHSATSLRFAASTLFKTEKPVTSLRIQLPNLRKANRKQQKLYVAR